VVVQDMFLTETAKHATVVLPLASALEREGTFTNAERRVQRSRQASRPSTDVRSVWEVTQQVAALIAEGVPAGAAARNGRGAATAVAEPSWGYVVAEDVTEAIAGAVSSYKGARPANLSNAGGTWGRQTGEQVYYDGTSYENTEGVGVQLAATADDPKAALTLSARVPEAPGEGIKLITAPRAYDNGDWAKGSKLLPRMVPAHIILSVADAQALGVAIGETVTLQSSAGAISLPAQIDSKLAQGLVLVPPVRGSGLAQVVTGAVTTVTLSRA
jgi:NADH-quinone oxidoreductase subunit G